MCWIGLISWEQDGHSKTFIILACSRHLVMVLTVWIFKFHLSKNHMSFMHFLNYKMTVSLFIIMRNELKMAPLRLTSPCRLLYCKVVFSSLFRPLIQVSNFETIRGSLMMSDWPNLFILVQKTCTLYTLNPLV